MERNIEEKQVVLHPVLEAFQLMFIVSMYRLTANHQLFPVTIIYWIQIVTLFNCVTFIAFKLKVSPALQEMEG